METGISTGQHDMLDTFIKTSVNFQGEEMILEDLIDRDDFRNMKSKVALCFELLESGKLCIGQKMDNLETIDSYYIECNFKRFKQNFTFDESSLKNIPETSVLVFSGFDHNELVKLLEGQELLQLTDKEDIERVGNHRAILLNDYSFKYICSQVKSKDIHWLLKKSDSVLVKRSVYNAALTMDALISESKKVNVLIGKPGSGKSVAITKIMNKIKRNVKRPKRWAIKIKLLSLREALEDLRKKVGPVDENAILDFLCQAEGMKKCWEKEMLQRAMKTPDCCHLFFDGFDEICPKYETTVLEMLKLCRGTEARIWITSRSAFQTILDNELDCCSYSLIEISDEQQSNFLEKYWRNTMENTSDKVIDELLTISRMFREPGISIVKEFIGFPTRTLMIADVSLGIFQSEINARKLSNEVSAAFKNEIDKFEDLDNILSFYDCFVDHKYNFFFQEKSNLRETSPSTASITRQSASTVHKNAAIRLLFPEDLHSLLIDFDGEFKTEEDINRIGLLVMDNGPVNFTHRTFAEYFVAKRLGEILTDRKCYEENGEKYQTVIGFLKKQYFAETNRMIRIFLDLTVATEDIHKAIIRDDKIKVLRSIKADKECIWQPDLLGRSAVHLMASYSKRYIFDLLKQSLKDAEEKICQTDRLQFNILCYAMAPRCRGYFKNPLNEMQPVESSPKIIQDEILRIATIGFHKKKSLGITCRYLTNLKNAKTSNFWKASWDFKSFFADDKNDFKMFKLLMKIAGRKFPWKLFYETLINKCMRSDQNFKELLADKDVDLSYLRNKKFLNCEQFQKWFERTKQKNDRESLRYAIELIGCPTLFHFLCKPSKEFMKVFKSALTIVKDTFPDVDLCFGNSRCDDHIIHFENLLIGDKFGQFNDILGALDYKTKNEVFDQLRFAKVAHEVVKKDDVDHVVRLLRLPAYQSNVEKMILGAEYQHFITCFHHLLMKSKKNWDISFINAFINHQEKQRVKKMLKFSFQSEPENMETDINRYYCLKPWFQQDRQWMDLYPVVKQLDTDWTFWEHSYYLIVCKQNNWDVPPDILSGFQPDYVSKFLAEKINYQDVLHLYNLATEEQKVQICQTDESGEFLRYAIHHYFEVIRECGGYMYKIGRDIPLERFAEVYEDFLKIGDFHTAVAFTTFLSHEKRVKVHELYYIPWILTHLKDNFTKVMPLFHSLTTEEKNEFCMDNGCDYSLQVFVRHSEENSDFVSRIRDYFRENFEAITELFYESTDEEQIAVCQDNDCEFLLYAIMNCFEMITDESCLNDSFGQWVRNEIPLQNLKFKMAFHVQKDDLTSLMKFTRFLSDSKQMEVCRTYFIPLILANKDSFQKVKYIFDKSSDELKREICRHNNFEFFFHAFVNYFEEILRKSYDGKYHSGKYLEMLGDEILMEKQQLEDAFFHLFKVNVSAFTSLSHYLTKKNQMEICGTYYIPKIFSINNSFEEMKYMFQHATRCQKREMCRHNHCEFFFHAFRNNFIQVSSYNYMYRPFFVKIQDEILMEKQQFDEALKYLLEVNNFSTIIDFNFRLNENNQLEICRTYFIPKILANKNSFAKVKYLFHHATHGQKLEICRHNDWEFLLHAMENYFDEILYYYGIMTYLSNKELYLRKIPWQEKTFEDALHRLLEDDVTSFFRFSRLISNSHQIELCRTYCVPKILDNKESFQTVKSVFGMSTKAQKLEICRSNDWEFLLHAMANYLDEIMDKTCDDGHYLTKINDDGLYLTRINEEMPLKDERFQKALLGALDRRQYTGLVNFFSILNPDDRSKLWREVYSDSVKVLQKSILDGDDNIDVEFLMHAMEVSKITGDQTWYSALTFPLAILNRISSMNLMKQPYAAVVSEFQKAILEKDFRKLEEVFLYKIHSIEEIWVWNCDNRPEMDVVHELRKSMSTLPCIDYLKHMFEMHSKRGVCAFLQLLPHDISDGTLHHPKDNFQSWFLYEYLKHEMYDLDHNEEKTLLTFLDNYSDSHCDTYFWKYILLLYNHFYFERSYSDSNDEN